jgi:hypothetical protein
MEQKPFLQISTIGKDLLESVQEQNGRLPDNFVDSAEGADVGLPDVHTDPDARSLLERVDAGVTALVETAAERDDED